MCASALPSDINKRTSNGQCGPVSWQCAAFGRCAKVRVTLIAMGMGAHDHLGYAPSVDDDCEVVSLRVQQRLEVFPSCLDDAVHCRLALCGASDDDLKSIALKQVARQRNVDCRLELVARQHPCDDSRALDCCNRRWYVILQLILDGCHADQVQIHLNLLRHLSKSMAAVLERAVCPVVQHGPRGILVV